MELKLKTEKGSPLEDNCLKEILADLPNLETLTLISRADLKQGLLALGESRTNGRRYWLCPNLTELDISTWPWGPQGIRKFVRSRWGEDTGNAHTQGLDALHMERPTRLKDFGLPKDLEVAVKEALERGAMQSLAVVDSARVD